MKYNLVIFFLVLVFANGSKMKKIGVRKILIIIKETAEILRNLEPYLSSHYSEEAIYTASCTYQFCWQYAIMLEWKTWPSVNGSSHPEVFLSDAPIRKLLLLNSRPLVVWFTFLTEILTTKEANMQDYSLNM